MNDIVFIIVLFVILIIVSVLVRILIEKHSFNKGVCRKCGNGLRMFKTGSGGERGYCCDKCGHHMWVSWRITDRRYIPNNNCITKSEIEEPETEAENNISENSDLEQ